MIGIMILKELNVHNNNFFKSINYSKNKNKIDLNFLWNNLY